jgi:hypothetical protein
MNAMATIAIEWTDDLDTICGYISQVDGIDGALLLGPDGLPLGWGVQTSEECELAAPWLLQSLLEAKEFALAHGLEAPDEQQSFSSTQFGLCRQVGSSYLVVQGTRGSLELFHGRIDRCAQMILQALKQRRLAE